MHESFNPPKRTLMGPGPSDVHPRVLQAMARPTVGHLDPEFIRMMDELKALLRLAFRTDNALTMPISGPGSVGMETCLVNLIEPGDRVVVCKNGVFGGRMAEIVKRAGGELTLVEDAWGAPVDPEKVEAAFEAHPDTRLLAFVHAETSTGACSDAEALAKIADRHGALTLVDAVTSLGGSPLEVDAWGLDAVYSGSQKCLSAPPGLSPITLSKRAVARIEARKTPCQSWFQDLSLLLGYWAGGKRSYHHTAPVNALYGLHEALVMLEAEGVEASWARHRRHHEGLLAGLAVLGLEPVVGEAHRLPQLNTVWIPEGVEDAPLRAALLEDHGLEIGGGLGDLAGKVWRIGLMGQACTRQNVLLCVSALEAGLGDRARGRGAVAAARARLDR